MKDKILFGFFCIACFAFLFTLLGQLGKVFWFFDNFSAFYLQYFIILVSCILYFLYRKKYIWSIIFLLPVIYISTFIISFSSSLPSNTLSRSYTVFHANVLYFNKRYEDLLSEIEKHDPDIIVLQETTSEWEEALPLLFEKYPYGVNKIENHFTAMIVRSRIEPLEIIDHEDLNIPIIELVFDDVRIFTAHPLAPVSKYFWETRNSQIQTLSSFLNTEGNKVLIGDFNISSYSPYFNSLEKYYVNKLYISWPTFFPFMGTAIDHVFSNLPVREFQVGNDIGSDHYPLIVKF